MFPPLLSICMPTVVQSTCILPGSVPRKTRHAPTSHTEAKAGDVNSFIPPSPQITTHFRRLGQVKEKLIPARGLPFWNNQSFQRFCNLLLVRSFPQGHSPPGASLRLSFYSEHLAQAIYWAISPSLISTACLSSR